MDDRLIGKRLHRFTGLLIHREQRTVSSELSVDQAVARIRSLTLQDGVDVWQPRTEKPFRGSVAPDALNITFGGSNVWEEKEVKARGNIRATENGCELLLQVSYRGAALMWVMMPCFLAFSIMELLNSGPVTLKIVMFFLFAGLIVSFLGDGVRLKNDVDRFCEILAEVLEPNTISSNINFGWAR